MADPDGLQRNIFPWIGYDDPFKDRQEGIPPHKTITAEEVVKKHGVPREELQKHIQKEIEESKNFWSLPFTLFFVAAFAMFVVSHDDAVVIRAVEDSIEFDIIENANWRFESNGNMGHKGVEDVQTVTDFWSWLTQGFIPLIFQQQNFFAELRNMSDPLIVNAAKSFNAHQRGVLLNHNRIIGGVRIRQERSEEVPCRSADILKDFYPGPCYGGKGSAKYELDPETWTARAIARGDNVTWFYAFEDQEVMIQRMRIMEAENWIDASTARIEISLPVYNAEFGLHTMVAINFLFSRGGEIWKIILPQSSYAEWWTYWFYAIYDICWVLALLNILWSELNEIYWFCKHKNFKQFITEYFSFWNVVDWVSMIFGFAILILSLLSFGQTAKVNEETILLANTPFTDIERYAEQTERYMLALEIILQYIFRLKLMLAGYPLVIVMRLFKAFAAQPRLALVTNTLLITGIDICHFMVVFCSIFTTIAISGLVLFGRQIGEFTTLLRAVNTVFFIMLGDFDYDAISHVGRVEGAVWLFGSIVVLNLLMLNIVLAIVMDGYSVVKANAAGGDTLFVEIGQTWSRFWNERRGDWVPLGVILDSLFEVEFELKLKNLEFHIAEEEGMLDTDAPKLVGLDCKPQVGIRVIPQDADIAHFVKEGRISKVSTTGLEVRVQHEDQVVRQYDTGRDLNFELRLAEGQAPVEFEDDGEQTEQHQVISPERLMKIVQVHNRKYRMSYKQALDLCMDAVTIFYKENSEEVDLDNVLQTARKVKFRVQKIAKVVDDGTCQTLTSSAPKIMKQLRAYLNRLYKTVDEERQVVHEQINQVKREIAELQMKLHEKHGPKPESLHGELHHHRHGGARWSVTSAAPRRRSLQGELQGVGHIHHAHHHHVHELEDQAAADDVSASTSQRGSAEMNGGQLGSASASSYESVSSAPESVFGLGDMGDAELLQELEFALKESAMIRKQVIPSSRELVANRSNSLSGRDAAKSGLPAGRGGADRRPRREGRRSRSASRSSASESGIVSEVTDI